MPSYFDHTDFFGPYFLHDLNICWNSKFKIQKYFSQISGSGSGGPKIIRIRNTLVLFHFVPSFLHIDPHPTLTTELRYCWLINVQRHPKVSSNQQAGIDGSRRKPQSLAIKNKVGYRWRRTTLLTLLFYLCSIREVLVFKGNPANLQFEDMRGVGHFTQVHQYRAFHICIESIGFVQPSTGSDTP